MDKTINVYAHFDIFYILEYLEKEYDEVNIDEVQHMMYLALLLSLFKKNKISDWGYKFIYKDGLPISSEVLTTIKAMISRNQVEYKNEYLKLSSSMKKLNIIDRLVNSEKFRGREVYLKAALDATISIPMPIIVRSIEEEPMIKKNTELGDVRTREFLGEGTSSINLYSNFKSIAEVLKDNSSNLWIVSILWLKYLYSVQKERI